MSPHLQSWDPCPQDFPQERMLLIFVQRVCLCPPSASGLGALPGHRLLPPSRVQRKECSLGCTGREGTMHLT